MLTLNVAPRMGRDMHALLAHAYHLVMLPIHLATLPVWRPLAACFVVALLGRLAKQATTRVWMGGIAVLVGWVVLAAPGISTIWPFTPLARLPGLALIVLADTLLAGRKWRPWVRLCTTAGLSAWWLRGAPVAGPGIANCVPVFVGLVVAFPLARRLSRRDEGWATLAAAAALATSLAITGAAPHWTKAALVPAMAALGLLGLPEAVPTLSGMVVAVAADALVASDRGRLIGVDLACLVPALAWMLAPRLVPRINRQAPAAAAALAALACVGLAWWAARFLAMR